MEPAPDVEAVLDLPTSMVEVPLALANLHHQLDDGADAVVRIQETDPDGGPLTDRFRDVSAGAGFAVNTVSKDDGPNKRFTAKLTKYWTLPDTVGPDMRVLVCGLNPSPYSADVGVGFARPGNRFWPAALAAGLVSTDRDPMKALADDGVGMTDLVKRPTRTAAELAADEYRDGLARVERLVAWLQPKVVCFVGLAGWRAAIDRKAVAGRQPAPFGGTAAYLMPSTSGLNAHSSAVDLQQHLAVTLAISCQSG